MLKRVLLLATLAWSTPADARDKIRGPSIYLLVDGALKVIIPLSPRASWKEDTSVPSAVSFTTVNGSRLEFRLGKEPLLGGLRTVRIHGRVLSCTVEVNKADAALTSELGKACADLRYETVPPDDVTWTVSVKPDTIPLAQLARVQFAITATNHGMSKATLHREWLQFSVDGHHEWGLGMAFSNGLMGNEWSKLSAGKTAKDNRIGFAQLVNAPGDHVITLSCYGTELARTTLHVMK